MLFITYTHASVVLVIILHYCALQNKQSQYDVGRCVVFISNKVEYPDKEGSYKNSIKDCVLSFLLIFSMQSTKCWTKFRFINAFYVVKTTSSMS